MDNQDINKMIVEANIKQRVQELLVSAEVVLNAKNNAQEVALRETIMGYIKNASRILGTITGKTGEKFIKPPSDSAEVIRYVRSAEKLSTLRQWAQSLRPVTSQMLYRKHQAASLAIQNNNWERAEKIVNDPSFSALVTLANMTAYDYRNGWVPQAKRKSKKVSLRNLPENWRELMAQGSVKGQFHLPMLAVLVTGARPEEIQRGIKFIRIGTELRVRIRGAKIKEYAGQPWRCFNVADHPLREMLLAYMDTQPNKNKLIVRVGNKNSLTTYMRALAKQLWPHRKEAITAYTARHAMASDCKFATRNGADEDLASMVLGHSVDKTQSYYGNLRQAGGDSMAPSNLRVSRAVRNKQKLKNSNRALPGRHRRTQKFK